MKVMTRPALIRTAGAASCAVCLAVGLVLLTGIEEGRAGVPPSTTPSADEARIRALIADQVTAWNAGDAKAFAASFAEDGSFTNIRGTLVYGRRAFEDRHAEIFRTIFKGSTITMLPLRIRFVRPDVAIVDIETEVRDIAAAPPGVRPAAPGRIRSRLQEVFVKEGGDWQVASFHNVDIKEP